MPMIMFFDTETSGLPIWDRPSDDPRQPHLVQFTAILCDSTPDNEIDYVDMLIKPDGWTIDPDAMKAHGITVERALAEGVPEREAVRAWLLLRARCDLVCGFNVAFDMRIMRIAMLRYGLPKSACDEIAAATKTHCVMQQARPHCSNLVPTDKMMAAGRKTGKTPSLAEAVKAVLRENMDDAHDARADALATMRLYFHMNPVRAA